MDTENEYIELRDADRRYVWHPFTQMREWAAEEPIIVSEARDCFLKDMRGRWYLDGVSSLWVNILGHRNPALNTAIKEQLGRAAHTTILGLSNPPAIRLAERLVGLIQKRLGPGPTPSRVFYSDNGSTSVEVAIKMAYQYWQHRGEPGRSKFVRLSNAYHGDTLGAVSVGGVDIFHEAFRPLLFETFKAPSPYCYRCQLGHTGPEDCGMACLDALEDILKGHAHECAALVIEPHVQAAGGMIVFPKGYVRGVRELCTRYGVLMIADEVATGFGRTGSTFASEHEHAVPDILCLSKGITGGYMPLAVTVATDEVFEAFLGEFGEMKTFFHGHSYTGNPLACACALAVMDELERLDIPGSLKEKTAMLRGWLKQVSALPQVGEARGLGLMAGVELVARKESREPYAWQQKMGWEVCYEARRQGVIIRPLGNVVVIMPPLVISAENLGRMLEVIGEGIVRATAA